jgi:hypothetical protein
VLERYVEKRAPRFGQHLGVAQQPAVYMDSPSAHVCHPRAHDELVVDGHGLPVADEDPGGDGREAVPGGQEPARLVERSGDESSVGQPGPRLVALVEVEASLVALGALFRRWRQVDSGGIVSAAPALGIVVRRDPVQRKPPCWKCALKKFSEPAVAIAAEAEISSASVAAATI